MCLFFYRLLISISKILGRARRHKIRDFRQGKATQNQRNIATTSQRNAKFIPKATQQTCRENALNIESQKGSQFEKINKIIKIYVRNRLILFTGFRRCPLGHARVTFWLRVIAYGTALGSICVPVCVNLAPLRLMPRAEPPRCTCLGCDGGQRRPKHVGLCSAYQRSNKEKGPYCASCANNHLCCFCHRNAVPQGSAEQVCDACHRTRCRCPGCGDGEEHHVSNVDLAIKPCSFDS